MSQIKNITEIILEGDSIERVEGLLNLKMGEEFYFSVSAPTPKSITDYKNHETNHRIPEKLLDNYIETLRQEERDFHDRHFKVVSIEKAYKRNHWHSVSGPRIEFVESIVVEDITNN